MAFQAPKPRDGPLRLQALRKVQSEIRMVTPPTQGRDIDRAAKKLWEHKHPMDDPSDWEAMTKEDDDIAHAYQDELRETAAKSSPPPTPTT